MAIASKRRRASKYTKTTTTPLNKKQATTSHSVPSARVTRSKSKLIMEKDTNIEPGIPGTNISAKASNPTPTSSLTSSPPSTLTRKISKKNTTFVTESDDSSFEMNTDMDSGDAVSLKSTKKQDAAALDSYENDSVNGDDLQSFKNDSEDEMFEGSLTSEDENDLADDYGDDFDDDFDDEQATRDEEDDFYEDLTQVKGPKIYETPFKVVTAKQIHEEQQHKIDHVASFLSVSNSEAKALLWVYKWHADALIESYIDNSRKIIEKAGLVADADGNPKSKDQYKATPAPPKYTCFICCEDSDSYPGNFLIFELECGHSLCVDCYRTYLRQKISGQGETLKIHCPQYKCSLLVPEDAIKYLFTTEGNVTNLKISQEEQDGDNILAKYEGFLDREFVQQDERTTFCSGVDCGLIIKLNSPLEDVNKKVPSVKCTCGHAFCFACKLDDHMPATCIVAKSWLKKCHDDSETANWIAANTQECNKCRSTIEKNGGCNHMTCKQCKHEFCWICMGDWSLHGTSYYNCSRYNEADAKTARSEQDKSRAELKRYLHYYNRYVNHQNSLKLDRETFEQMQKKMKQLQDTAGMSWIEVQFLSQAFDVLSASRHTLTWTYAFAYYLRKTTRTIIFEDNQNDLEVAVEQLSELFEKPANDLASLKVQLLDKCQYVSSRRVVLLEDVAQGLEEGIWEYVGLPM